MVTPVEVHAADWMVVAAAKVSTSRAAALRAAENHTESERLINDLMEHKHGTPFEHNQFKFFVDAPIFVFREWQRHRVGWSYNEFSGRYATFKPKFWVPRPERAIFTTEDFSPMRPAFAGGDDHPRRVTAHYRRKHYQDAYDQYRYQLDMGIGKEVARSVLPVGTYSSMWATCNARSLMHFIGLRTHDESANHISYPQAEIEEAARVLETVFAEAMPLTYAAFMRYGREAP